MFGIEDFAFEGVVTEQAFQPIVGEGGFTDREAVRKFGVGEKSYAVKQSFRTIGVRNGLTTIPHKVFFVARNAQWQHCEPTAKSDTL